jgi:hypothetical protein
MCISASGVRHVERGPEPASADLANEVVAAAYEHALPLVGSDGDHPLIRVVEGSAPILHCMRFVVELLPPDDGNSTREGWTR